MARYREEAEKAEKESRNEKNSGIETIPKSCPICRGDVNGDDVYLYFCKHCNILFKKIELMVTEERIDIALKKTVAEKYSGELKIGHEAIPLKKVIERKRKIEERNQRHHQDLKKEKDSQKEKEQVYVASKTSNKLHTKNCPFAKNIKKANRIIFKTLNEAKNYKKCNCID